MSVEKYEQLSAETTERLQELVNDRVLAGWTVCGAVSALQLGNRVIYFQSVVIPQAKGQLQ
ncbi:MAG: hypothetical protein RL254_1014 [Planctomycetota bacterium]|jgi:hypothetical protein